MDETGEMEKRKITSTVMKILFERYAIMYKNVQKQESLKKRRQQREEKGVSTIYSAKITKKRKTKRGTERVNKKRIRIRFE